MQHTVQRRYVERPVGAHGRLGQGRAADVDLVLKLTLGVEQEQLPDRTDTKHSLRHEHDRSARWHPQFVLPFQLARLIKSVDFSVCGAEEDVARHIRDRLSKNHSPSIKRPLLHALLDTDQLMQRPGWWLAIAISGRRIDRFRLPGCAKINQILIIYRRGSHHTFASEFECPQRLAKRIQGIQLGVVASHKDGVVGGNRRGGGHPAPCLKCPLDHAVLPHGIHLVIEGANVDGAVRPNARGGALHTGTKRGDPFQRTKGIHCIKVAVAGADVNGSIQIDRRGRCDGTPNLERPLHGAVGVNRIQAPGT